MPRILSAFERYNVKGLFFVSTELLDENKYLVKLIESEGHEVGSHGHFHEVYSNPERANADMKLSFGILGVCHYRAPKFSYVTKDRYSNPKNHVSVLKKMWLGQGIPEEPIFYIHPFDLVGGVNAPNLFCKLWYSRPKDAYETFTNLLRRYPGDNRLH